LNRNPRINTSPRIDFPAKKQDPPSHSLRNNTLSHLAAECETIDSGNPIDCLTSESEAEDDEDNSEDDDEGDEDNDWSGQDSYLEAIILRAVGDDLPLAAHLIPILHRSLRLEVAINATEKLGSWRYGVIKSTPGDRESGNQISANYTSESTINPRKRQRREGSTNQNRKLEDFEEEDDDDDDDPREFNGIDEDMGPEGQPPLPRLACLFHKHDPAKYSIQHGNVEGSKKAEYRTCEGPGFKSMQRLKYEPIRA
jgi:hypothetical protein